jgi:hypothetical protein
MGTACPRIVNRWLSSYKVTTWFNLHRPALNNYIQSQNPTTVPSWIWWVYIVAMNAFTNYTAITFRFIQGAMTLVRQKNAAFEKLISTFVDDVGIQGPLSPADIEVHENVGANVSSSPLSVLKASICENLVVLASWVEEIIEEADA